jgi:hypothetical protein
MQGIRRDSGTRFRIFPQAPFLHPGRPPELVTISTPCGLIGPGPSDHRLYVVNPIGKRFPYGAVADSSSRLRVVLPPWRGPIVAPVRPGPDGHFDHIPADTPEFAEAHAFAVIRFVLDVWERYFGRPIRWHFGHQFRRLEVAMRPEFDNAQCGYGYMEVGAHHRGDGTVAPFALNFDVIAHELGHLIIYSTVGIPTVVVPAEYSGFQESAADTAAMIAVLHFDSVIDDLLDQTHGNLYAYNELNRFAELSGTDQVRMASNSVKLSEFAAGWDDEHDLSQPLTGALFDILVDIFQENLVARGLVGREIADMADEVRTRPEYEAKVRAVFDVVYPREPEAFRAALMDTRDYLGVALAETWKRLSADGLNYAVIAETLLAVDRRLTGGRFHDQMLESFAWRDIGRVTVGPRRKPPDKSSHAASARTLVPRGHGRSTTAYSDRMMRARGR